ncbi:MAG: RadC family protein [Thermodesulfovibrionales bacterium]
MTYLSIKDWPEDERPRERLLKHGHEQMSDAHLLAIILRTGGSGRSAVDIALELLGTFGSLRKLEHAPLKDICSIKGLGKAKAAQIKAALELGRRGCKEQVPKGPCFSNGKDVFDYFHPRLTGLRKEVFCCALLDVKNRLMQEVRVSEGTLTASLIHPREAFLCAVKESAASVIFVHNHPSGDPSPSRDDIAITGRLREAGEMIGIKVLDHIIIGDGQYASMLEQGHLQA